MGQRWTSRKWNITKLIEATFRWLINQSSNLTTEDKDQAAAKVEKDITKIEKITIETKKNLTVIEGNNKAGDIKITVDTIDDLYITHSKSIIYFN